MEQKHPDSYDVLYLLKPIEEIEPGWWRLKWRPLYRHTWAAYRSKYSDTKGLGFRFWRSDAHNGWNRSWDHFHVELTLFLWTYNFWMRWNFVVGKDGPSDLIVSRPLVLPVKVVDSEGYSLRAGAINYYDPILGPRHVVGTRKHESSNDSDFATGVMIGAVTHDPLMGAALGGSLVGGMIGAALSPPNEEEGFSGDGGESGGAGASANWDSGDTSSESLDSSSSCDSSNSDSSGSCDSGSSDS